jgi:hypothetical protein
MDKIINEGYIDPLFEFIPLNERCDICTCTDMGDCISPSDCG